MLAPLNFQQLTLLIIVLHSLSLYDQLRFDLSLLPHIEATQTNLLFCQTFEIANISQLHHNAYQLHLIVTHFSIRSLFLPLPLSFSYLPGINHLGIARHSASQSIYRTNVIPDLYSLANQSINTRYSTSFFPGWRPVRLQSRCSFVRASTCRSPRTVSRAGIWNEMGVEIRLALRQFEDYSNSIHIFAQRVEVERDDRVLTLSLSRPLQDNAPRLTHSLASSMSIIHFSSDWECNKKNRKVFIKHLSL